MRNQDIFKTDESTIIERKALEIFKSYLDKYNIDYALAENDRTLYVDGKIYINNRAYEVQIKGIGKGSSHDIKLKYLGYAKKNFILYIIVDNVRNDSEESVIYYKTLDEKDITKAMKNSTKISKNVLEFLTAGDIDVFVKYVEDSYTEYCRRTSIGIDLSENLELFEMEQTLVFTSKFDEDNDICEITPESLEFRNGENAFSPVVDFSKFEIVAIDYKEDEEILLPDFDVKIKRSFNKLNNITSYKYEDLLIQYSHSTKMIRWKIKDFNNDIDKLAIYKNYIKFCEHYVPDEIMVFDDGITLIDKVKEIELFKEYINPAGLKYGKIDKDSLGTLYNNRLNTDIFPKGYKLVTLNSKINLLCYNNGNEVKLIHNQKYAELFYLENDSKVIITENSYTFYYLREDIKEKYLNIYNMDYYLILKLDENNIKNVYSEDLLGTLIFNYLKIYWRYRKDIELLKVLEKYTSDRAESTSNISFFVNYIQVKKILNKDLKDVEIQILISYLQSELVNEDKKIELCIHTVLENKLIAKNIFNNLKLEDKAIFEDYPIYELYKRL